MKTAEYMSSIQRVTHPASIEQTKPALAAQLLADLCDGKKNMREISRETGVSYWTLIEFRDRHTETIDRRRQQLAEDAFELAEGLRQLAKLKVRMMLENPDEIKETNIRDFAQSYKAVMDSGLQSWGEEQKIVVDKKHDGIALADAVKAIEEAKKQIQKVSAVEANEVAVEAEVVSDKEGNAPA